MSPLLLMALACAPEPPPPPEPAALTLPPAVPPLVALPDLVLDGSHYRQWRLWPELPPDGLGQLETPEWVEPVVDEPVGGRPWLALHDVSTPSLLFFPPQGEPSGQTVLVFPGGGYHILAIDLEGTELCQLLNAHGHGCAVLKYRVPRSGCHWDAECVCNRIPEVPIALQDAQRAMSLLRAHAPELGIDPQRIGVMGFSAGGNLVAMSATWGQRRAYEPVDAVDAFSPRPDFAVPVYPGHMDMTHHNDPQGRGVLNTDLVFHPDMGPTFIVHAQDDPVNPYMYALLYQGELERVGVPVQLYGPPTGGHAFGLRSPTPDTARWSEELLAWMATLPG